MTEKYLEKLTEKKKKKNKLSLDDKFTVSSKFRLAIAILTKKNEKIISHFDIQGIRSNRSNSIENRC